MIKIANEIIDKTIKHLNRYYPVDDDVYIHICDGCDCIEAPDGGKGFGLFIPDTKEIYIATDLPDPESSLIETIAHEYMHFMQMCKGVPYCEESAEFFGRKILKEINRGEIK